MGTANRKNFLWEYKAFDPAYVKDITFKRTPTAGATVKSLSYMVKAEPTLKMLEATKS